MYQYNWKNLLPEKGNLKNALQAENISQLDIIF